MTPNMRRIFAFSRLLMVLALAWFPNACSYQHAIVISPLVTPERVDSSISSKRAAYVMTDDDRRRQVSTEGGGNDKVSYFPYRDLEKAIRDTLSAIYLDVIVVKSPSDSNVIQENDISFVFTPEIITSSNSESMLTWPPTRFTIDLTCNVTDPVGNTISIIQVVGSGAAEYSEFTSDFGLAGRRAASEVSEKLMREIIADPRLH